MTSNSQPPIFPTEIWLQIVDHVILPSLLHLALTSRTLYSICEERLQTHVAIRTKYRHFKYGDFRELDDHPYHTLLLQILKGYCPPSYIIGLFGNEDCRVEYLESEYPDVNGGEDLEPYHLEETDKELIRNAMDERRWIYTRPVEDYLEKMEAGDEDAVLCVLLPLLKKLRWWVAPMSIVLLPQVIMKIAVREHEIEAEAEAETKNGTQQRQRIFPNLTQLATTAYNGDSFGIDIETLAKLTTLPSLRRVYAAGVLDFEFRKWPDGLPLSKAAEVFFVYSSITADSIKAFAQGFEGPCVMRINWTSDGSMRQTEEREWNRFEIRIQDSYENSAEGNDGAGRSEIMDMSCPIERRMYNIPSFWPDSIVF